MFDFNRVQQQVHEYYFKLFRHYNKPDATDYFIKRWLDLIRSYSVAKDFIAFDPTLPVLHRLVPRPRALVLVPFPNVQVSWGPHISVFPYYPLRVKKERHDVTCHAGLEFLHLYLELTGLRTLCLYNFFPGQERRIVAELQDTYPGIRIYGKGSYDSFLRTTRFGRGDSKCPSRSRARQGTPGRWAGPSSSPAGSGNSESL